MSAVRVSRKTTSSTTTCWSLLADFGNFQLVNPHLSGSYLLNGAPAPGLGCERHCELKGGGHMRERVVDWREGHSYTVAIYDSTMPIENTRTTVGVETGADGRTLLFMQSEWQSRGGVLGALLDRLVIRRAVRSAFRDVLDRLAAEAERREAADRQTG